MPATAVSSCPTASWPLIVGVGETLKSPYPISLVGELSDVVVTYPDFEPETLSEITAERSAAAST